MATKKKARHYAKLHLVGELVERAHVIGVATEWPKIAAKVLVRHNPDLQTTVNVVAIGPAGDRLLAVKVGEHIEISGQLRATTGVLELFAEGVGEPEQRRAMYSLFGINRPHIDDEDWKGESEDEEE